MRIASTNIPNEKKIGISLRYIFGVGPTLAKSILAQAGIDTEKRTKDLTEAEQDKITVIVFDNVCKIMPSPGGFGVNTVPGNTYVKPDTTIVTVSFKPNTYAIEDLLIDSFNPFMIVNLDRGKEIHLPDNPPTSLVNPSYFKTSEDNSDPASGRYYKTKSNLPWAVRISSSFDYTNESAQITSAYLKFAAWAESGGVQYTDWYLKNSGYRDESNIFQVPQ